MKNIKALVFYLSFLALNFLNLPTSAGQVKTHLRAGLNYSTVKAKNLDWIEGTDIRDPLWHLHAGVSIEWFLAKKYSLMGGLIYSVKGYSNFSEVTNKILPRDLHLHYLSIPITANYSVFYNFQIGAGVEFGYQLTDYFPVWKDMWDAEFENISAHHDFGGLIQLRYQLMPVEMGITAYAGFVKIIQTQEEGIERYYKNRNLQFYVAYVFSSE